MSEIWFFRLLQVSSFNGKMNALNEVGCSTWNWLYSYLYHCKFNVSNFIISQYSLQGASLSFDNFVKLRGVVLYVLCVVLNTQFVLNAVCCSIDWFTQSCVLLAQQINRVISNVSYYGHRHHGYDDIEYLTMEMVAVSCLPLLILVLFYASYHNLFINTSRW